MASHKPPVSAMSNPSKLASINIRATAVKAWNVLRIAYGKWQEDEGSLLAAAMAYYAALSLFPLLLVALSVMGFVTRLSPGVRDRQQQLIDLVARDISPWVSEQLAQLLAGVETQASVGGPVGIVTLLLTAIGVFIQFEDMFDRLWGRPVAVTRGLWGALRRALFDRLAAFLVLLTLSAMLVALFIAGVVISTARTWADNVLAIAPFWLAVQVLTTSALYWFLFTAIYKWLPAAHVRWADAASGGLLAAISWQLGQQVFERYVIADRFSAYGVVGSFIAVMLWVFYASHVIFFGAEIVQAICSQRTPEENAGSHCEQLERLTVNQNA